jgi:hypothetical protein
MTKIKLEIDLSSSIVELAGIISGLSVMCGLAADSFQDLEKAALSKDFSGQSNHSLQDKPEPKLETKAPVVSQSDHAIDALKYIVPPTPKAVMPVAPAPVVAAPVVAAPVVAAPVVAAPVVAAPVVAAPVVAAPVASIASGVTIKDLRDLMSTKVTKHVEILRFKLAEFGTANVSSLKPELYEEFYTYLSSLD